MVDSIESLEDHAITTIAEVTGKEFYLAGHFPGAPIVPGAILQEMTTQSAGILIAARFNPMEEFNTEDPFFNEYALGVLVRVKGSRFRDFARPGDTLQIRVKLAALIGENFFEFTARVTRCSQLIMSNRFQLTNIPSRSLQGMETEDGMRTPQ